MPYDTQNRQRSRLEDMQRRADEFRAAREAQGIGPDAGSDEVAEAARAAKRKRLALLVAIEAVVAIAIIGGIVVAASSAFSAAAIG